MIRGISRGMLPCLLSAALAFAAVPPKDKPADGRGPQGETVRTYTKEWTDDFQGFHKEVHGLHEDA